MLAEMQRQRAVAQLAGRLQRVEQKIVDADRELLLHIRAQRLPVERAGGRGGGLRLWSWFGDRLRFRDGGRGRPGRGRSIPARSSSVAPFGKTELMVRNIG